MELLLYPATSVLIGGGGRRAQVNAVHVTTESATVLIDLLADTPTTSVSEQAVNGHVGGVCRRGSRVTGVVSFSVKGHLVRDVRIVADPDKRSTGTPTLTDRVAKRTVSPIHELSVRPCTPRYGLPLSKN
ncbi:MAG: hypothetical protein ABJD68_18615 [Nakamurella sp.]